jgi:tetratricopeptide (TPR) repeat protein
LGEVERAIQSYQRAIKIQPSSAAAHYNLGNTFERINGFFTIS